MSNELSFLGGETPTEIEEVVPAAGADVVETPPTPEPAAAPVPATIEPGHVPLSAMLDEREKRQSLERQLSDLRGQMAPPPPVPLEEQVEARLYTANLNASRRFAEREYGKEVMGTVHEWASAKCDGDPLFNQQMRSSDDPYEAAMQAYNRDRVISEVSAGDLEAFRAWKAASAAAQGQSAPSPSYAKASEGTHPSPPASEVPRSLANAPGNGASGHTSVPVGEGNAYAGLFK